MKKTYRVQWMNEEQYSEYMSGAIFYNYQEEFVEAETEEEAVVIVKEKYPTCVEVNRNVLTTEELEAQEAARKEARKAEEEKKAAAKARKLARDAAAGITPEKRKAMDNLKRHEYTLAGYKRQMEELEKLIKEEEEIIAKKKEKIAKM